MGESGEDVVSRHNCFRAFFLLSGHVGPAAGEAELSGRLRRLSHDGHAATPLSSAPSVWGIKPDAAQKSRMLESKVLLPRS